MFSLCTQCAYIKGNIKAISWTDVEVKCWTSLGENPSQKNHLNPERFRTRATLQPNSFLHSHFARTREQRTKYASLKSLESGQDPNAIINK